MKKIFIIFLSLVTVFQGWAFEQDKYYTINRNLLFAIKLPVEEVKLLREAAHNGITSLQEAEKALKSKRKGFWSDRKREHAIKTIDIFRKITL